MSMEWQKQRGKKKQWRNEALLRLQVLYIQAGPPLWSNGQSSWLYIQRPGFDSRLYQIFRIVGLERGPLSLVSTIKELLEIKK
jgi:hypothetical protein